MKEWMNKHKADLILYGMLIGMLLLLIGLAVIPQIKVIGTNEPYNQTAIAFSDSLGIQWYAIFIVSGLVMATYFAMVEFKRLGWKTDDLLDGLLIIAPLAILGTRAYYLIFDPNNDYTFSEFFQAFFRFRDGGLAIHGAIIVAVVGVIIFARVKKLNVFLLADVLAIGLLIGQISGRWGNFMNAEAHGNEVMSGSFITKVLPGFIEHQMKFDGSNMLSNGFYHPTFLYESLWNFAGLTFLLIARRKKWFKAGDILGIYLIWYGVGRSFLEAFYRTDQLIIFGSIPVNVLLSLVLLAGGGALYLILKRVFVRDEIYYVEALKNDLKTPWEKIENVV